MQCRQGTMLYVQRTWHNTEVNMGVYTTINDPSAYFQIALYNGNNSTNTITNTGNSNLQADWLWFKERSSTSSHHIFDTSRGVGGSGKALYSDTNDAEGNDAALTSVNTDGFTLASTNGFNQSGQTNVAWQWKANGGSRTTFSESGTNPGGGYQANTTAGFSIIDYSGTSGAGTVQHGLGAVPHLIIVKRRNSSDAWRVYHKDLGLNGSYPNYLQLNSNAAKESGDNGNFTAVPSSTVFSVGDYSVVNTNNSTYIAYAFTGKQGYSKFGKYTGNGQNDDGPFIYTGFKPRYVWFKRTDAAEEWYIYDSVRDPINVIDRKIFIDNSAAESQSETLDFVSNGIKLRNSSSAFNADGATYIYAAFAETPFVSSAGVPTTAR